MPETPNEQFSLVVDVVQRRPACVIIQAVFGVPNANRSAVSMLFDSKSWLTAPTADMRLISGTREQWDKFAAECNAREYR